MRAFVELVGDKTGHVLGRVGPLVTQAMLLQGERTMRLGSGRGVSLRVVTQCEHPGCGAWRIKVDGAEKTD